MRKELFIPFERERRTNIPTRGRAGLDVLSWEAEKSGLYSAKSAYRLIFGSSGSDGEASGSSSINGMWNQVWQLRVLPRIKV